MNKEELKMILAGLGLAVVVVNIVIASAVFWLRFLH